jgi:hypothetical protein
MARTFLRLDLAEVVVLSLVMLVIGWHGGQAWQRRQPLGEGMLAEGEEQLQEFAQRYGPHHYSRNAEEWIVRDFLGGPAAPSVIVDLA